MKFWVAFRASHSRWVSLRWPHKKMLHAIESSALSGAKLSEAS